jgi:hypothetical protein
MHAFCILSPKDSFLVNTDIGVCMHARVRQRFTPGCETGEDSAHIWSRLLLSLTSADVSRSHKQRTQALIPTPATRPISPYGAASPSASLSSEDASGYSSSDYDTSSRIHSHLRQRRLADSHPPPLPPQLPCAVAEATVQRDQDPCDKDNENHRNPFTKMYFP